MELLKELQGESKIELPEEYGNPRESLEQISGEIPVNSGRISERFPRVISAEISGGILELLEESYNGWNSLGNPTKSS